MSHSQFHSTKLFILRHAWLNLWDKRMTTGRINQVNIFIKKTEIDSTISNVHAHLALTHTGKPNANKRKTHISVIIYRFAFFTFFRKTKTQRLKVFSHYSVSSRISSLAHNAFPSHTKCSCELWHGISKQRIESINLWSQRNRENGFGSTAKRIDFSTHETAPHIQFHSTKLNKFSQKFNAQLFHSKTYDEASKPNWKDTTSIIKQKKFTINILGVLL
jgi:hypothetical protein